MCRINYSLLLFFLLMNLNIYCQDWTWMKGANVINQTPSYGTLGIASNLNDPGARTSSSSWTDASGNFWLLGGSISSSSYTLKADLWMYNPSTNQWTWKKGPSTQNNTGIYGTQGVSNSNNYPGARMNAVTWTDNIGNLWLFGGNGFGASAPGKLADLWKYNISTNQWTWVNGPSSISFLGNYGTQGVASASNAPGCRELSHGFFYNGFLFLFGGNGSTPNGSGSLNDMWKFNISTGQWTWIKGSNSINSVNTRGTIGISNINNTPCGRQGGGYTTNGTGVFYFFGGEFYSNVYYSDLWKYDAVTNNWTWIKGPSNTNLVSVYGTQGVPSPGNYPGCRHRGILTFTGCGLYFFGGYGKGGGNTLAYLNDLWRFDLVSNNWTYIKGSTANNQPGTYGTIAVSSATNKPGAREYPLTWVDSNLDFWILGGWGYANSNTFGLLSDLWKFNVPTPIITSNNSLSICSGNAVNLGLTSDIPSSFTWQAINNNSVNGETTISTASSIINDVLINQTTLPQNIIYNVTPTSNNGCIGTTQSINVTINPTPTITNNSLSQAICSGVNTTAVTWTPNVAGTSYAWTGVASAATVTGFTASGNGNLPVMAIVNSSNASQTVTYTVTPSRNGCNGPAVSYVITVNPTPVLTLSGNQIICGGQTTTVSAHTNSVAGGSFSYAIQNPASIPATVTGYPTTGNGQIPAATIHNSGTSPSTLTYLVTPTANNCNGTAGTYTITVNPAPVTTFSQGNQTICTGQNTTLVNLSSTTPGVTFSWNLQGAVPAGLLNLNPTSGTSSIPVFSNLMNNTTAPISVVFQAQATTSGPAQCPGALSNYTITINPSPIASSSFISNDTICSGQNINIALSSTTAGTTYTWTASNGAGVSGGQNSAAPSSTINQALTNNSASVGIVTYTVTPSASSCAGTPLQVLAYVNPVAVVGSFNPIVVCPGVTITPPTFVSNPNGATFGWSNTNAQIGLDTSGIGQIASWTAPSDTNNNSPGTIVGTVTVTPTLNACPGTPASFVVTINPNPSISLNNSTICAGEIATITAIPSIPGGSFIWSNGDTSNILAISPISSDTLTVQYELNGCYSLLYTSIVQVNTLPQTTIISSGPIVFCNESSVVLSSTSNTGNLWSTGSTNQNIEVNESSMIVLTVFDNNGCSNSDSIDVINTGYSCFSYPTIFTPNGDGSNDTWQIIGIENYPNATVEIFNRWGQQVFSSEGYPAPWNGTYNNEPLPTGDYFFIIDLGDGNPVNGALTLKN